MLVFRKYSLQVNFNAFKRACPLFCYFDGQQFLFFRESLDQAPPGFYPAPIFRTPGPFHRGLINCETVLPTENGNALKVKADIRLIYLNPTAGW